MSPLPSAREVASARAVTAEDWRALRIESLAAGVDAGDSLDTVLLGYQSKLLATVSKHAVTICEKSRRTGATWAVGALAVLTSASVGDQGGMDSLYIGYNLDMAREFVDCAAMWAKAFGAALAGEGIDEFLFEDGDDRKAISAFRIRFASGFEIVALASRPRSLRGRQGFVIVDEAAFHDDLKELMKAANALSIWGGRVLVISTHDGEDNYYNTLVKSARSGAQDYGYCRFDLDDALRDGVYRRICLRNGWTWSVEKEAEWRTALIRQYGDAADEELFCIPSEGSGAWLTAALIEARARPDIPVLRLTRPPEFTHWPAHLRERDVSEWCERELLPPLKRCDPVLWHYLGADYGRVSDLTVLWPLAIGRTLKRLTPFVVEMRRIPFDQQRQVQSYVLSRLPRYGASKHDATGLGFSLAEAAGQEFGALRAEAVMLNVPWYRENAQPLKTAFEDGMLEIPADAEIAADLRMIHVKAGVPFVPNLRVGEHKDRHGDSAVALMLAWAATRAVMLAYDYESARTAAEARPDEDEDERREGGERRLW